MDIESKQSKVKSKVDIRSRESFNDSCTISLANSTFADSMKNGKIKNFY